MNTNINMEQLQKDAVDIFHQGFACSESVIYALRKNFELEMSDDAIAMSTGFPWGPARAAASAAPLPELPWSSATSTDVPCREIPRTYAALLCATSFTTSLKKPAAAPAAGY